MTTIAPVIPPVLDSWIPPYMDGDAFKKAVADGIVNPGILSPVPKASLLSWLQGATISGVDLDGDGDTDVGLLDKVGSSNAPVLKSQSFAFDGSTHIALPSSISLAGDFEIEFSSAFSTDYARVFGSSLSAWDSYVRVDHTTTLKRLAVGFVGDENTIDLADFTNSTDLHTFKLTRSSGVITAEMDGVAQSGSITNSSTLTINYIGAQNATRMDGTLHSLTILDANGNYALFCPCTNAVGTSVPMQINGLLAYGTLTGATLPDFYASHQDGLTGFNPNVLGYSERENLHTYSESIDNPGYIGVRATHSVEATDSIGSVNLWDIYETTDNGTHHIDGPAFPIETGEVYTVSVHLKKLGRQYVTVDLFGATTNVTYDLDAGTVESSGGDDLLGASIEEVRDGEFRASFQFSEATNTSVQIRVWLNEDSLDVTTGTYVGDVTKGVKTGGWQIEKASSVGEYVATTSAPIQGIQPAPGYELTQNFLPDTDTPEGFSSTYDPVFVYGLADPNGGTKAFSMEIAPGETGAIVSNPAYTQNTGLTVSDYVYDIAYLRVAAGNPTVRLRKPSNSSVILSVTSEWQKYAVGSECTTGGNVYWTVETTGSPGDRIEIAFPQAARSEDAAYIETSSSLAVTQITPNYSKDILGNTLQYPKVRLSPAYTGYTGAWDGTAYGVLDSTVTLSGDFKVEALLYASGSSFKALIADNVANNIPIYISDTRYVRAIIDDVVHNFTTIVIDTTGLDVVTVERVGDQCTVSYKGSSQTLTVSTGDVSLDRIGCWGNGNNAWDTPVPWIKIYNSDDTLIHHWVVEGNPENNQDVIYDVVGGNNAQLSGASLPFFNIESDKATYLMLNGWSLAQNHCAYSWDLSQLTSSGTGSTVADEIGLDGTANKASTVTDSGTANRYYHKPATLTVTEVCIRIFIKKKTSGSAWVYFSADGDSSNYRGFFNPVTGTLNTTGSANRQGEVVSATYNGEDWWVVYLWDNGKPGSVASSFYFEPAGSSDGVSNDNNATGSVVVGNYEIHQGKSIAEVKEIPITYTNGSAIPLSYTPAKEGEVEWTPDGVELITNGSFLTDSDWDKPAGASISDGKAVFSSVSGGQQFYQNTAQPIGIYRITFTVDECTEGAFHPYLHGPGVSGTNRSVPGTYTEDLVATSEVQRFSIRAAGTTSGKFDNISVQKLESSLASVSAQSALGQALTASPGELLAYKAGAGFYSPQDKRLINADVVSQYGADSLPTTDFLDTSEWETINTSSVSDMSFTTTTNGGVYLDTFGTDYIEAGKTYKLTVALSTTATEVQFYNNIENSTLIDNPVGTGSGTHIFTATRTGGLYIRNLGGGQTTFTVLTIQELQDPINFLFEPDGDARPLTYSSLLPSFGSELWGDPPSTVGTDWTDNGDGSYTNNGLSSNWLSDSGILTIGNTYQLSFTLSGVTGGMVQLHSAVWDETENFSANGSFTRMLTAAGTGAGFYPNSFVGTISNISIKEITSTGANTNDQYFAKIIDSEVKELFINSSPLGGSDLTKMKKRCKITT